LVRLRPIQVRPHSFFRLFETILSLRLHPSYDWTCPSINLIGCCNPEIVAFM
jgi:hypothetical protein